MPSEADYITGTEFSFEQQSTLNLMTLDNQRQAWATLGLSDQLRDTGVYAKGALGNAISRFYKWRRNK
jgi:hypothetical protein